MKGERNRCCFLYSSDSEKMLPFKIDPKYGDTSELPSSAYHTAIYIKMPDGGCSELPDSIQVRFLLLLPRSNSGLRALNIIELPNGSISQAANGPLNRFFNFCDQDMSFTSQDQLLQGMFDNIIEMSDNLTDDIPEIADPVPPFTDTEGEDFGGKIEFGPSF